MRLGRGCVFQFWEETKLNGKCSLLERRETLCMTSSDLYMFFCLYNLVYIYMHVYMIYIYIQTCIIHLFWIVVTYLFVTKLTSYWHNCNVSHAIESSLLSRMLVTFKISRYPAVPCGSPSIVSWLKNHDAPRCKSWCQDASYTVSRYLNIWWFCCGICFWKVSLWKWQRFYFDLKVTTFSLELKGGSHAIHPWSLKLFTWKSAPIYNIEKEINKPSFCWSSIR